jgi:rare lipoprotein A
MLPILTTLSVLSSWYGPGFDGRLTANGERYNQHALTAAHKTLPFGTRLRVCFLRCAVVRVNDRGPYIRGREIDLSKGAADAIGLTDSGVGRIKVTRLN